MEQQLIEFAFTSGIKVQIKKISPYLIQELGKKFPPPEPPVEEVTMMTGEKVSEPNPQNEQYIKDLAEYEINQEALMRGFLMKKAVVYELTEEDKKQLVDLREEYMKEYKIELPEKDDKVAFLTYIAVADSMDVSNLIEKIVGRVQPTQSAIQNAQNQFPRPVRR